jgi:outer membrane protein assembly factor BamA
MVSCGNRQHIRISRRATLMFTISVSMVRANNYLLIGFLLLALIIYSGTAQAITTIRSITFEGNEVTRDIFLRRTIYFAEGSIYNEDCLVESVQALMDTGLFKTVEYYVSSDMPEEEDADDSQVDLIIRVREKHYLLVLPRIRIRDNETHVGIQLRWDNVFGLNHSLRYLAEDRGTTLGINEKRNELKYAYPEVNGSDYSLGVEFTEQNEVDISQPGLEANRIDQAATISVHRWLNPYGRNYGWFANMGWTVNDRVNDLLNPALADETLGAVVLGLGYGYSKTHDYGYNRAGKEYGYALNIANQAFGSETEFARHELYYRSYYRFPTRPLDNLNVQTILGHATHDIMGGKAFGLGGEDLRGYDPGRFTGNALLQLNMEYLQPFENHPQWRYAGFIDMGNTYEDVEDVIHGGLKTGVGVGLRWRLISFVRVSLRLDVGYAIADDDYRITAGTHYAY